MKVLAFEISEAPSPWRDILAREVDKLKARADVIAIGVAGSLAYGDVWSHSDIDIEVLLRGEHQFTVLNTEQEMSVDFGFFGENDLNHFPDETRPIYDPQETMTRELASRDLDKRRPQEISEIMNGCEEYLQQAQTALAHDPQSALVFLHAYAWDISDALTIAAGDNRTVRRRCSRLQHAVAAHHREDLFDWCTQIYGFPKTRDHSRELLLELRQGYREVWPFFKGKTMGPRYMIQQPDSELWFRNRIEPVHDNDPRDLVWLVYLEFPFVTHYLFINLTKHEKLPPNMFEESRNFTESARRWITRHLRCLELFDKEEPEKLLGVARNLYSEAKQFAKEKVPTFASGSKQKG